jgi:hypothetical protein
MALTLRKTFLSKGSNYLSKNTFVEDMINSVIKEKLYSILNINRMIYFKLIEYFPSYAISPFSDEKMIVSVYLRIRNRPTEKFSHIEMREIELSGINIVEFINYLNINGATEITNAVQLLEQI